MLAVLADEEDGGGLGAKHLVTEHAELLEGIRYAIGEFGGFTQEVAGKRFYPIQVSEKQVCGVQATFRGPAGHGVDARARRRDGEAGRRSCGRSTASACRCTSRRS